MVVITFILKTAFYWGNSGINSINYLVTGIFACSRYPDPHRRIRVLGMAFQHIFQDATYIPNRIVKSVEHIFHSRPRFDVAFGHICSACCSTKRSIYEPWAAIAASYVSFDECVRTPAFGAASYGAVFFVDLAAGVAELVDALDLGSSDENRGGSNPSARTSL
jgi:hypothetical protein